MTFHINIEMDNAAFGEGDNGYEVARILNEIAKSVNGVNLYDGDGGQVRDINGNKVGAWEVVEEERGRGKRKRR
jgi:hypothetical protein